MIAQFALRLIVGMSGAWAVMPRRDVTSGFFRIQMLVTLGLSVLAALTGNQISATDAAADAMLWASVASAGCSFLGSVFWTLERRRAGTFFGLIVLGLSAAALAIAALAMPASEGISSLFVLSELATAAMVGGFVAAMLLGHWYLTAPGMPLRPLSRCNTLLGIAIALRLGVSVAGLILGWALLKTQTQALWLTLRWGAGIIGPAILVVMVHRILKYRNTQAATGVLFVGVILSFIGELSATLLSAELKIPF